MRVCGTDLAFLSNILFDDVLDGLTKADRPRLLFVFSVGGDRGEGDRRPKKDLGDHCDFSDLGSESERADLLCTRMDVDVCSRVSF